MKEVVVIDYGAGNVQSVKFALERLGYKGVLSANPEVIAAAERVIFPGVGQAEAAMSALKAAGLDELIPTLTQPLLGICLGMQLLCSFSEEGETKGMGVFKEDVKRFEPKLKIPQMGWNQITNCQSPLLEGVNNEYVYFVHSYYVPESAFAIASCDYITPFSAALQKDNFYACQFHPEKSGIVGEQVLRNFLKI